MGKIGIALSGGGHRASLFAAGVLLYLVDAGRNRDVSVMSSVSGGSLTNGYVALQKNFGDADSPRFEESLRPFLHRIANEGTLWGWNGTWYYLLILAGVLGTALGAWWSSWSLLFGGDVFWALVIVGGCLLRYRGHICGLAFGNRLYSGRPKLTDIAATGIDHVFCATDLHAGEHVYFSGKFVCAYRFGVGQPGNLPLHVAVQSSAAFPGGFPARWLRTARFGFTAGKRPDAAWMALIDGGVYDNMAEQWPVNLGNRKRRRGWEALSDAHEPDELIVVNASKNLSWSSRWSLLIPWLGEVLTLKCVTDITYDNTTTGRRQVLVRKFDQADRDGRGLRGCLVMIEQSPLKVPTVFADQMTDWPERAERATAALEKLATTADEDWDALAERNADVPTTLRSLGTDRSVDLLYHGYILAMCNLHVILGYPLMDLPARARFSRLVQGTD